MVRWKRRHLPVALQQIGQRHVRQRLAVVEPEVSEVIERVASADLAEANDAGVAAFLLEKGFSVLA